MCEHGRTVPVRVWIAAGHSHSGEGYWKEAEIDSCIAPMVDTLQKRGVYMLASCCGHGRGPGSIDLANGGRIELDFID